MINAFSSKQIKLKKMNALGGVHAVIVCLINGCEITVPTVWQ